MTVPYFEDGSRACTRCGCVVSDPSRELHIAFHERVDPEPVAEPEPTPEPEPGAESSESAEQVDYSSLPD